jgi:hypothetical protein
MACERCKKPDGRAVDPYHLKGGVRVFCLECALITSQFHDMTPQPEAPEAEEAKIEEEPQPEAPEAEEAEAIPPRRGRR